jgi:glucosamine--fructose-6-phosphate aminotransferase (isomerizing)
MCGIIGYVGNENAIKVTIEGLKTLEYRGYDSAGIAWRNENKIMVKKDVGYVEHVLKGIDEKAGVCIGHTRWATHGKASKINAHPHIDCKGLVAVVHNGVLTNFAELKKELEKKGHVFVSETDTELIPHLIEEGLRNGLSIKEAFKNAISKLEGSFAVLAIFKDEQMLACAKNKSPLVISKTEHGYGAASDVNALAWGKEFLFLEDGDVVFLSENGIDIEREVKWAKMIVDEKEISKKGYPHFMLKEIYEQMEFDKREISAAALKEFLNSANDEIDIIACGTSFHAGMFLSYLLRKKGICANTYIASEYKFIKPPSPHIIAISQSGETADVLRAVEYAKSSGAKVHAVLNVRNSTLERCADSISYINAGPEFGVAATKTFSAQILLFLKALSYPTKIGQAVSHVLSMENKIKEIATKIKDTSNCFYLGRGFSYPLAMEGALKLKEITYIHAEAYPGGELKHGPISLIDKNVWVVALMPNDETKEYMKSNVEEVISRGAKVLVVGECGEGGAIPIPTSLFPFGHVVALQLLAYYVAVLKGLNPDKPRNLAKSVTVE